MPVHFRVLGPVEAEIDGERVDLGHARQRCVLAVLLVEADRVVPVDVLLDRVWAGRLPRKARVTLSGYVSRLRRLLATGEVGLTREADGYRLAVDPMTVDLYRFRDLLTRARTDRDAALFAQALALWRGPAFATLDTLWLSGVRDELAAERLAAELDRNELALAQGQHVALLSELTTRATAHPWDERLAGQLMLALYRCGRQADALQHYDRLRSRLADELGTDPSPPLRQLHQRILTADHTLAGELPVPRQLPSAPGSFTGRARELAYLDTLLRTAPSTVVISAVSGTAGVGKTAMALHWAHRIAGQFPDGQLYVNLRGFDPDGSVLRPADAMRELLAALEVPPHRVPDGVAAQSALYRSMLAGRRMLVVLDNARDAGQVEPLLPGTPGCLVVVTSRDQLTSLVAGRCARPLTLDLLTTEEARELLASRIGAARVAAEPAAVDEIITACARLPLALAIAAARATTHPHFPLHTLAAELRDSHGRLDAFADTNPRTDIRAVFSWSYRALSTDAARLFRLLGPHPGPDVTVLAAASLTALPLARVRPLLTELTRAHLLTEHLPGRYTCHDLLRTYANEQADITDTAAERHDATHRLLDHYLHSALAATHLIDPYQGNPVGLVPARAGIVLEEFADKEQAVAWLTTEHQVLLAAINHAAHHGFETYTWSLAWALSEYSYRRGHWFELGTAFLTALRAAERVADPRGQAEAYRGLGTSHHMQGQHDQANRYFRYALKHFEQLGDHVTVADVHESMGLVAEKLGCPEDALDHAQQALDLQRTAGDHIGQARALNSTGWYHLILGNYDTAVRYLEQAVALLADTTDWSGIAAVWDGLGYAHHHVGHYERAVECYEHALRVDHAFGNRYCAAEILTHLGDTHQAAGNHAKARETWQRALDIFDDLDLPEAQELRAKLRSNPLTRRQQRTLG